MRKKIKITERGWAGHYICSQDCGFRRNTLIEYGKKRIVVSTVGNYQPQETGIKELDNSKRRNQIGWDRYYETMAFEAKKQGVYLEADVTKQLEFNSKWSINKLENKTDLEANEMHEDVIKEIIKSFKE